MDRVRKAVSALLVAGMVALPYTPALAKDDQGRKRDRYEDRWGNGGYSRYDRDDSGYWDAARYYQNDERRYRPRRLNQNDRIYRGSDNRYYCEHDDGTTGLIVGGMAGGVLGNIIAPGSWKTVGTIIGAGTGALIGRKVDRGDVTCR